MPKATFFDPFARIMVRPVLSRAEMNGKATHNLLALLKAVRADIGRLTRASGHDDYDAPPPILSPDETGKLKTLEAHLLEIKSVLSGREHIPSPVRQEKTPTKRQLAIRAKNKRPIHWLTKD